MTRGEPLDDLFQEYDQHNEKLRKLNDELKSNAEQLRRIYEDMERVMGAIQEASDQEAKEALLFEAEELGQRWEQADEETERLREAEEESRKEGVALKERVDAGMENIHTAALETEKMMFELGKLVATLDVAAIVAASAVTPALLPRLNSLEGLWPALGWLLTSTAVSVIMCFFSIINVSQLLARGSARRGGGSKKKRKLPEKASWVLRSLPYPILLTFSAGALLIGIGKFALFISMNLG